MLALQTDYLTIDVERVDYEPAISSVGVNNDYSELKRTVTIQCNWKLRRTHFTSKVVKSEETEIWYDLEQYDTVYNPLRIIADMGYEVPVDTKCHKLIRKAIEEFYSSVESDTVDISKSITDIHATIVPNIS